MAKNKYGYLIGILLATVVAFIVAYFLWVYVVIETAKSAMTLGGSNEIPIVPLLLLCGYLLIAFLLAYFSNRLFGSKLFAAFLLNVLPLVVLISIPFILEQFYEQERMSERSRNAAIAISDAPNFHLETPFVNKVQNKSGGVILFFHVPFTVSKTVQAQSLRFLTPLRLSEKPIRYSPKQTCNRGFERPDWVFHVVDRKHNVSPLPLAVSGVKIVSEELQPNRRYYLLRELYFSHSSCRVSDYKDFDPTRISVTLSTSRAERNLR